MSAKLVKLAGWATVAVFVYAAGVLGLSEFIIRDEGFATPAFQLWRYHAFPYVDRYVKEGLYDRGTRVILDQIKGHALDKVKARFGASSAKLVNAKVDARGGKTEIYELSRPSGYVVVMVDGKCIELYPPGP